MSAGKAAAGLAALGALGLGLYIFKDQIMSVVKGAGIGGAPTTAPGATGLAGYNLSISKPAGINYFDVEVRPDYIDKVLNTGEFPDNVPVWVDDDYVGNLNASDYPLANPGYNLGRALRVPDKYIGTGKHVITIQVPSVTYGLPAHYPSITYPGGVQAFVVYL